jgi:hypothetical protein
VPDVLVLQKLSEAHDLKAAIQKALPDLSGMKIQGTKVLVALYVAPERTKSGLYRTTGQLKEDIYQGTVGLVVLRGLGTFMDGWRDGARFEFHGFSAAIGEWAIFRPGDGKRIQLQGVDCRWVEDADIDGVIDDPELITYR